MYRPLAPAPSDDPIRARNRMRGASAFGDFRVVGLAGQHCRPTGRAATRRAVAWLRLSESGSPPVGYQRWEDCSFPAIPTAARIMYTVASL